MRSQNNAVLRLLSLCMLLCITGSSVRAADSIVVSAAASLTNALNEIGAAFQKARPGTTVRFNFGASGALQQQIEQGAPVDVFASAGVKEMDRLVKEGLITPGTRQDFTGNRLVLIAPNGTKVSGWSDLAMPMVRRVAISAPESVPSGRYAKETLIHRGLWDAVQKKAVMGETVRQTLAYVANGDVEAGIVFATDARIEKNRVHVVSEATPGKDHAPIVYPAAVVKQAKNPTVAAEFVRFLDSPAAQAILKKYGFTKSTVPPGEPGKHVYGNSSTQ